MTVFRYSIVTGFRVHAIVVRVRFGPGASASWRYRFPIEQRATGCIRPRADANKTVNLTNLNAAGARSKPKSLTGRLTQCHEPPLLRSATPFAAPINHSSPKRFRECSDERDRVVELRRRYLKALIASVGDEVPPSGKLRQPALCMVGCFARLPCAQYLLQFRVRAHIIPPVLDINVPERSFQYAWCTTGHHCGKNGLVQLKARRIATTRR